MTLLGLKNRLSIERKILLGKSEKTAVVHHNDFDRLKFYLNAYITYRKLFKKISPKFFDMTVFANELDR